LCRRGLIEDYIETCIALVLVTSTTLLALSAVLSHIALGG
jgi:hypothetical protein